MAEAKLLNRAWRVAIDPTAKLVLLAHAEFADDGWFSRLSVPAIMDVTGLADRTVQRALKRLVDGGHITRLVSPSCWTVTQVHPR